MRDWIEDTLGAIALFVALYGVSMLACVFGG